MFKTTTKSSICIISAMCLIIIIMSSSTSISNVQAMNFAEQIAEQQQLAGKSSASLAVIDNPELVVRVLDNLLRSVIYSLNVDVQSNQNNAQKRGLDLGISRGFSGSQAGKHLMGLSAASFANGPGR